MLVPACAVQLCPPSSGHKGRAEPLRTLPAHSPPQACRARLDAFLEPREEAAGTQFALFEAKKIEELVLPLLGCEAVREAQRLGAALTLRRCPHTLSVAVKRRLVGGLMQL